LAVLSRKFLGRLATARRNDARLLLRNRRWSAAYYLYGLSVELAIKAVVAKKVAAQTIPEKGFLNSFYSHKLEELIILAGLKSLLDKETGNQQFRANWEFVRGWSIESRYEGDDEARARAISNAVDDRKTGVVPWLKRHW
jgi:HEPN domain-containing protein